MKRSVESEDRSNPVLPNPLAGTHRRHRRQLELGTPIACPRCGLEAPEALRRVPKGLFEAHHPFGRQHDSSLTVAVCASCHAILSARQLDDQVRLVKVPTTLERVVAIVGALGSHLRELGEALLEWSVRGRTMIDGLDRDFPEWRKQPWAK